MLNALLYINNTLGQRAEAYQPGVTVRNGLFQATKLRASCRKGLGNLLAF